MNTTKIRWGFAVLGVVSYFGVSLLLGVGLGIMIELGELASIDDIPPFALTLITIPIGLLSSWITYRLLKNHWEKSAEERKGSEILDQDLIQ